MATTILYLNIIAGCELGEILGSHRHVHTPRQQQRDLQKQDGMLNLQEAENQMRRDVACVQKMPK